MKKIKKTLALLCCAVLLVVISVGATIAYLTSTDVVNNTFTVGQVKIELDEADTNEDGKPLVNGQPVDITEENVANAPRVDKNNYKLLPAMTYVKDPTVHVLPDTDTADYQDCYVIAKVTVNKAANLLKLLPVSENEIGIAGIVTGGVLDYTYTKDGNVWKSTEANLTQTVMTDDTIEFMIYFNKPVTPNSIGGDPVDLVLFERIVMPDEWDNDEIAMLEGLTIDVDAFAVQAAGFNSAEEAYNTVNWTEE